MSAVPFGGRRPPLQLKHISQPLRARSSFSIFSSLYTAGTAALQKPFQRSVISFRQAGSTFRTLCLSFGLRERNERRRSKRRNAVRWANLGRQRRGQDEHYFACRAPGSVASDLY